MPNRRQIAATGSSPFLIATTNAIRSFTAQVSFQTIGKSSLPTS
jgi:hypothetical protein